MSEKEQEVKIYVTDLGTIQQKLQRLGASLISERIYERNVRYDTEDRQFNDEDRLLRLRRDTRTRLTYKSPSTIEKGIITREEIEVEVADFDKMEKILGKIGFTPHMVYEKYRTTYELDDVEIVLDELPYGNFVEVEGTPNAIEAMLDKLELDNVERIKHSYAKLFDFIKHHLELTFRDLTFENFEDIDVPTSAFIPPGSIVIR